MGDTRGKPGIGAQRRGIVEGSGAGFHARRMLPDPSFRELRWVCSHLAVNWFFIGPKRLFCQDPSLVLRRDM